MYLCRNGSNRRAIPGGLSKLSFTKTLGLSLHTRKEHKCTQSSPLQSSCGLDHVDRGSLKSL